MSPFTIGPSQPRQEKRGLLGNQISRCICLPLPSKARIRPVPRTEDREKHSVSDVLTRMLRKTRTLVGKVLFQMEIRQAKTSDSAGIAKVQVNSYLNTYEGILPPLYLSHFSFEEQEQDWEEWFSSNTHPLFVAVEGRNDILGYALGQINSDKGLSYDCELVALHVQRAHQRRGIGSRLFSTVSKHLAALNCNNLFLWVLEENPSRKFYEKLGGEYLTDKQWQNNEYFETKIIEVAYGWSDIRKLFID